MTQGSTFYVYDPWGRRIWKQWTGQTGANECEAYFYGATGQKLESYSCEYTPNTIDWFTTLEGINTYFGGKMLSEKGVAVLTDRLGSVRANSNGESFSYFPWGEERGTGTADGRTKFAGYYRDQPGQDYANARYYCATTGSFWSPDPGGMKTADSTSPTTGTAMRMSQAIQSTLSIRAAGFNATRRSAVNNSKRTHVEPILPCWAVIRPRMRQVAPIILGQRIGGAAVAGLFSILSLVFGQPLASLCQRLEPQTARVNLDLRELNESLNATGGCRNGYPYRNYDGANLRNRKYRWYGCKHERARNYGRDQ